MQRLTSPRFFAALALGLLVGCDGGPTPTGRTTSEAKPFAGATVTVACADADFAKELAGRVAGWAARTGAAARVQPGAPADADAAAIRPAELGALAARGELEPMPGGFKAADNPLQWGRVVAVYRQNLATWAADVDAMPLAGDGYVLAYRADRFGDEAHRDAFRRKFGRPLAPPTTWEDVAEVAGYFRAADGKPSLPPLPRDAGRLLVRFHQLAACYDHAGRTDARQSGANPGLAFHFHPDTWTPRLDAPGFTAAADWLSRTRSLRPAEPSDDPIAALDRGAAVLAVLSLAEVGKLPRDEKTGEVAARFRLAPLPGTRTYFDAAGKPKPAEQRANYVPYLGSGGWVGVVFKRSPARDAAWDLLAELGSPTAATARLSDPHLGAGPYRAEHLDESRDQVWLRYGFDAARTRELGAALRRYVRPEVSNPALALRTPDQAALMASLEAEVRKAATGALAPVEAMKQAQAAWRKHDAAHPHEELVRWRRNAIGLP